MTIWIFSVCPTALVSIFLFTYLLCTGACSITGGLSHSWPLKTTNRANEWTKLALRSNTLLFWFISLVNVSPKKSLRPNNFVNPWFQTQKSLFERKTSHSPVKWNLKRNILNLGKSCQDLSMLHVKIISRYGRTLHGCQETRSWQHLQERLIMTWRDVPSNKSSIAPKSTN